MAKEIMTIFERLLLFITIPWLALYVSLVFSDSKDVIYYAGLLGCLTGLHIALSGKLPFSDYFDEVPKALKILGYTVFVSLIILSFSFDIFRLIAQL